MNEFSRLKLDDALQRAVREAGFTAMTPVQAASLPAILEGRDVVAEAQTGSGKTAAFALGLLAALDADAVKLQGLVLCPTRELADQVSREIRRLARFVPNVKVLTLCGGVPLRPHLASLAHEPHIVVGTPGRLLDLMARDALPMQALKVLVIDEADRMLDMGFADAMREIIGRTPRKRQTLLFSATIPDEVRAISRDFQDDPVDIAIETEAAPAIAQTFIEADAERKVDVLAALLMKHRPESVIVFCNQRDDVRRVRDELDARGFSVLALHGELDQRRREEMLVQFANRSANVLVASDVAARGLDIHELPMVVSFDLASDPDTHLHRIGRTGRAGRSGLAFGLVGPRDMRRARAIEERGGEALYWNNAPVVPEDASPAPAPFATLAVDAGRQEKLRPGDLLGALTGEAGLPAEAIGKIDIFPTRSYAAVSQEWMTRALKRLREGRIKNRRFRVRRIRG